MSASSTTSFDELSLHKKINLCTLSSKREWDIIHKELERMRVCTVVFLVHEHIIFTQNKRMLESFHFSSPKCKSIPLPRKEHSVFAIKEIGVY